MFDLDQALTIIPARTDGASVTMKVRPADEISVSATIQNRMLELPAVEGAGISSTCTVCMEGFRPIAVGKQLPCSHVFHAVCIETWLSVQNSCPLCRFSVYTTT